MPLLSVTVAKTKLSMYAKIWPKEIKSFAEKQWVHFSDRMTFECIHIVHEEGRKKCIEPIPLTLSRGEIHSSNLKWRSIFRPSNLNGLRLKATDNYIAEIDCRSYVDQLSENDVSQCGEALIHIKDAVIGSNRQKAYMISQGVVPKLIEKICNPDEDISIRLDALIVIGSLAKGSTDQVQSLITDYNIVRVLVNQVLIPDTDQRIIEHCLTCLRSVYQFSFAPVNLICSNISTLSYLMGLASSDSSLQIQACVTSILATLCNSYNEQILLCQAGAIPYLARMISSQYDILKIPALRCLACMCFTNRCVSDNVCVTSYEGKSLPDILSSLLSRVRDPEIQLTAARCLTYIHRSGTLPPADYRIVYKTLPCLARLCTDDFDQYTRASAAETLAYLAEIDSQLQRLAAICNHLIKSLSELLQSQLVLLRQAAFRCFASLSANDEDIRKKIIETKGLMERVLEGLADPNTQVSLAAVRCLHSLSRSVQQLRTTFQDHSVWKPLMGLLSGQPTNELLTVVTSTICNLLLEFSPAKEPMFDSGVVEMLCLLTENSDPALRLNGSWALMNMAFQAEQHVKTKIINSLGTDRILDLLSDSDTRVVMKTLGLLRNLLSKSLHIDDIMSEHSREVMQAVNMVLDSQHPPEVKEQALCIVGNIAAGAQGRDYIIDNDNILIRLSSFLNQKDCKLQAGTLFAIGNLVHRKDSRSRERYLKLTEMGIISNLQDLFEKTPNGTESNEEIRNILKHLQFS